MLPSVHLTLAGAERGQELGVAREDAELAEGARNADLVGAGLEHPVGWV